MLLEKMYIISGIRAKDQKRVYVGHDSISGGYPYWTDRFHNAVQYKTPTALTDMTQSYMLNEVTSWDMLEVELIGKVVQAGDMAAYVKAKAQEKMDALNAELERELAALKKIGK